MEHKEGQELVTNSNDLVRKADRLEKGRNLYDQPIIDKLILAVSEDFIGVDSSMTKVCVAITARNMTQSQEQQDPKQVSRKSARQVFGYMKRKGIEFPTIQARPVTGAIQTFLMQIEGLGEYLTQQTRGAYSYTGELKNPEAHHVDELTYKEWIKRKRVAEKRKTETVGLSEVFRLRTNISKRNTDDVEDDLI